ncbi:hypothetical protein [uncultured Clostridium sp.]|uniref:hypothetical protein n=1 Tax=uncultured Clostridium sp. TaxID=59620 RepID=UPI00272CE859|nr:hypothetical protein [uncultured Clostridium sp.]
MEKIKKSFSENKTFIITLLICIFLTSSSMMILLYRHNNSTSSSTDTSEIITEDTSLKDFEPYITELSKINTSLKKCINGLTINSKSASNILNDNLKELKELKEKVSAVVIANNDTPNIIPTLISCIENTENLYSYCINVLSYTNNLSISEITSEILILKSNCEKSYEDLSIYGFSLTLPEESETFLDNLISYLNTLEKVNKEASIKTTQYNSYIEKLTKCTNEFDEILDDLEPAINLIRKENRSLDIILNDIKEKERTIETIKKDFNYSSIPEGCMSYYNSLNNTFTLYSGYLNALKIAVIYEKSSPSYEKNKKTINKNYDNAYSKYDDVKTSFESLLNSF